MTFAEFDIGSSFSIFAAIILLFGSVTFDFVVALFANTTNCEFSLAFELSASEFELHPDVEMNKIVVNNPINLIPEILLARLMIIPQHYLLFFCKIVTIGKSEFTQHSIKLLIMSITI